MSDLGATLGVYAARPRIQVEGRPQPELELGVITLFTEETESGIARCEITLGNWGPRGGGNVDFLYDDRALLDWGKEIKVEFGSGDASGSVFTGRITGIEGRYAPDRPPELVVLAEDRLQDLRMTRRSRSWAEMSDADIARQIASDHGLSAEIDVSGPTYAAVAQVGQSDLAFLRERAALIDAVVWVAGASLKLKAYTGRPEDRVELTWGQRLKAFSVLGDLAHQRTKLTASGWDPSAKEAVSHEAAASVISAELDGRQSGPAILASAFGERPELLALQQPVQLAEARAIAEAQFRKAARRFVTGRGEAEGDARITVGAKVDLRGLGPLFSGAYRVTESRHAFDLTQGYRTLFRCERPGVGE